MSWTTPRTWVSGELVTALLMNTHVRDNLNSLRSEHFLTSTFRGVHLRTSADQDIAAKTVVLKSADEVVMSDATRLSVTTPLSADITASGAGGLDTGAEAASTWYEVYLIAKDDGTKSLLLHRSKDWTADVTFSTQNTNSALRDASARTKLAQSFTTVTAGSMPFVDLYHPNKTGTPSGRFWVTIEADSAGSPSGTALATSDKLSANNMWTTAANGWIRYAFRTMPSLSAATTYWIVLQGDYTVGASYISWNRDSAGGYASGSAKSYDGASWSAVTGDFDFVTYVERNSAAITYPSGYTKSCKLGQVYNDGSSNFQQFEARDRHVRVYNSAGADLISGASNTVPSRIAVARIPPEAGSITLMCGGSVAQDLIIVAGAPGGYGGYQTPGNVRWATVQTASDICFEQEVMTELQALYSYRFSGTGTYQMATTGYRW